MGPASIWRGLLFEQIQYTHISHTYTHTHACTCTPHIHTPSHMYIHTCMHTHTSHTHSLTHVHTHMHAYPHPSADGNRVAFRSSSRTAVTSAMAQGPTSPQYHVAVKCLYLYAHPDVSYVGLTLYLRICKHGLYNKLQRMLRMIRFTSALRIHWGVFAVHILNKCNNQRYVFLIQTLKEHRCCNNQHL